MKVVQQGLCSSIGFYSKTIFWDNAHNTIITLGLFPSLLKQGEVCFLLCETTSMLIVFNSYRSQFIPRTRRTRWPGSRLWQHLGVRLWYRNDPANGWNFNRLDRIRFRGQRAWCHGNTTEMVIKQKGWPGARLDVCKQQISIRGIIKAGKHSKHRAGPTVYSRNQQIPGTALLDVGQLSRGMTGWSKTLWRWQTKASVVCLICSICGRRQ